MEESIVFQTNRARQLNVHKQKNEVEYAMYNN